MEVIRTTQHFVLLKFTLKGMEKHKDKLAAFLGKMSDWLLALDPSWLEAAPWNSFN